MLTTGLDGVHVAPPAARDLDERVAASLAIDDRLRAAAGQAALGVVRATPSARDVELTPRLAPATIAAISGSPSNAAPSPGAARPVTGQLAPGGGRATAATAPATAAAPQPALGASTAPAATAAAPQRPGSAPLASDAASDLAPGLAPDPAIELWLDEQWDTGVLGGNLPGRGLRALSALALDAGHAGGPIVVVPAARLTAVAAYVAPSPDIPRATLLVNPVMLAALEPVLDEPSVATAVDHRADPATGRGAPDPLAQTPVASTGGNPYSFYGSVEECADAQRERCEACLPGSTCTPVTDASNGNTECTMLAANSGRGYFLLCINLALAITSVDRCTGGAAPSCARDPHAADALTTLEDNSDFLTDPTCAGALDGCLAEIYGAPSQPFPGLDGGTAPAPPRSTTISCSEACGAKNTNCEASPSCNCSGPSCNNSLSCNSECASSNDQSGCGACTSNSGGSGCSSGSSGGGCSSGSGGCSSGSSSSGGGCSSCSSSSCGSGGSCGNGGCSGGSCGGSNSCGGSKCSVAASDAGPGVSIAVSMLWALLPLPLAARARRRAHDRARAVRSPDSQCADHAPAGRAHAEAAAVAPVTDAATGPARCSPAEADAPRIRELPRDAGCGTAATVCACDVANERASTCAEAVHAVARAPATSPPARDDRAHAPASVSAPLACATSPPARDDRAHAPASASAPLACATSRSPRDDRAQALASASAPLACATSPSPRDDRGAARSTSQPGKELP